VTNVFILFSVQNCTTTNVRDAEPAICEAAKPSRPGPKTIVLYIDSRWLDVCHLAKAKK